MHRQDSKIPFFLFFPFAKWVENICAVQRTQKRLAHNRFYWFQSFSCLQFEWKCCKMQMRARCINSNLYNLSPIGIVVVVEPDLSLIPLNLPQIMPLERCFMSLREIFYSSTALRVWMRLLCEHFGVSWFVFSAFRKCNSQIFAVLHLDFIFMVHMRKNDGFVYNSLSHSPSIAIQRRIGEASQCIGINYQIL